MSARPIINAALQHGADAVDTTRERLMGRHAAGEGFLKAYVRYAGVDRFICHAPERTSFEDFTRRVAAWDDRKRDCVWAPADQPDRLRNTGMVQLHGPDLASHAWVRRRADQRGHSLCGLTHTLSSNTAMDFIGGLAVAPVQPWDALICTSKAAKAVVEGLIDRWQGYLKDRLGSAPALPVELPVIPLGVDAAALAPTAARQALRQSWRGRLGIGSDDLVVLFLGRLSFHAKAHPVPMYMAVERAAQQVQRKVHLIQAGWFANDAIATGFRDTAKAFAPSINTIFVDGRKPDIRSEIWSAADVFCSLSDNIQETYGLAPVEAMAAGLPAVVSDWNGYRDTVRDGIDGFTVPTLAAPAGSGEAIARRYESGTDNYDRYIGQASQFAAVDINVTAQALQRLFADADLRAQMGQAAQQRARSEFDWAVIVRRYQDLWAELATRRATAAEIAPKRPGAPSSPLREDPFSLFAGYPSIAFGPKVVISLGPDASADRITALRRFMMNDVAAIEQPPAEHVEVIFRTLKQYGPSTAGDLLQLFPAARQSAIARGLVWLAKFDLIRFAPPA